MKKKILIIACVIICIVFLALVIFSALCVGSVFHDRKEEENNYLLASKNIAYELNEYIETGESDYLKYIASDIIHMSNMTDSAKNIVSNNNANIIKNLAGILEFDNSVIEKEADNLKKAFEMIAQNDENTDYAYAQIQFSITNCGY